MEDIDIGYILKLHRKHSGLSRLELAEIAGVGKTVIYDIEHGKETVQFSSLIKVLAALNIKIRYESPVMEFLLSKTNEHEKS
ncbi:MAG: helix-turn-helix domain-containing protein [Acidobacteria bacterium]|jgi:y4mF family transcriptional regulator|nr:helix-turn-helix domain-containing protein [Acidobacteriota bacterium]